jgi:hypothetical protein
LQPVEVCPAPAAGKLDGRERLAANERGVVDRQATARFDPFDGLDGKETMRNLRGDFHDLRHDRLVIGTTEIVFVGAEILGLVALEQRLSELGQIGIFDVMGRRRASGRAPLLRRNDKDDASLRAGEDAGEMPGRESDSGILNHGVSMQIDFHRFAFAVGERVNRMNLAGRFGFLVVHHVARWGGVWLWRRLNDQLTTQE